MKQKYNVFSLMIFLIGMASGYVSPQSVYGNPPAGTQETASDTIRYLNIPERATDAISGSAFVSKVTNLDLTEREKEVVKEILSGNVPSFARRLNPITIRQTLNSKSYEFIFFTVCDYMAIGSDQDYLYIPMTPATAQYLADKLDCTLPTKKMVDLIYNSAEIKLRPQPIPPSDKMITIPVFWQHTDSIKQQIAEKGIDRLGDTIFGGNKKDIIISNKIYSTDRNYDRVVIYGWHRSVNDPIQPVYNGHIAQYADYSHGVRLIAQTATINGDSCKITDILKDQALAPLISSEGVISKPFYPSDDIFTSVGHRVNSLPMNFKLDQNYPNPFNPITVISYKLSQKSIVDLSIFMATGKKVATLVDAEQPEGTYRIKWNAVACASGVYFYRLMAGDFVQVKKMLLVK